MQLSLNCPRLYLLYEYIRVVFGLCEDPVWNYFKCPFSVFIILTLCLSVVSSMENYTSTN
jgi:hypothetical protein